MRNAINTLQSAYAGFGSITQDSVMKICDQPSPKMTESILVACKNGDIDRACLKLQDVLNDGYSAIDFITTIFRVVQKFNCETQMKLDWIKLIAFANMRIADGLGTHIQLTSLLAEMCERATNGKSKSEEFFI